jgi:ABC-type multidrug transport system fused ATPase/permease subunit
MYNFSRSTYEIIETLIRFTSSMIALFYFNLSSGFVVVFFVIMAVTIVLQFDKRLRSYWREINHAENATSQKVFDFISNITTVIILRMERIASLEIMKKIMAPYGTFSKFTKTNEMKWMLVSLMSAAMIFGVLVAYFLHSAATGSVVLVGTVFVLYSYVDRISGLFYRFAYRYSDIVQQKTAVDNAEEIAKDFVVRPKVRQFPLDKWSTIKIEHLTFSYDEKTAKDDTDPNRQVEHLRLKDTAFIIRRGEKIALIGESGSGKTTFLKLLRGLYTPEAVRITVDGKTVEGFGALSDSIALIPQDPELFTTTIRENITMGVAYDDETLQEYTDLACFTHVADRLPNRLESSIKEKGVNLSGGEKQRLALARGLIAGRGKEIILMDEPTSSVDSKNERAIYKNVFEHYADATIISTVHRLHLLTMFDTIHLFDSGKLVASGNLEKLLKNPRFKKIWKKYHEKG